MRPRALGLCLLIAAGCAPVPEPAPAAGDPERRTVVAVFAHPDDERIVAPLLNRYAREGHDVHLVIATDGRLGVREHAGIPAGDSLAAARADEARCATDALGIAPPIMVGLEDAGMASFSALQRLRQELRRVFRELEPDAVITFGPEGGTGHPDHRLTGVITTEVVQTGGEGIPVSLYYASLPAERMETAPEASPHVTPMPERLLTVSVPVEPRDIEAGVRSFACHATQYTPEEMAAVNAYLAHGFDGAIHLRPWTGETERRTELFPD